MSTYIKRVVSASYTPQAPNEFSSYKSVPTGGHETVSSDTYVDWNYFTTSCVVDWKRRRLWAGPEVGGNYFFKGGGILAKANVDSGVLLEKYDLSTLADGYGTAPVASGWSSWMSLQNLGMYIGQDDYGYMMNSQGVLFKIDLGTQYQTEKTPTLAATFGMPVNLGGNTSVTCPFISVTWVANGYLDPTTYRYLAFLPWKSSLSFVSSAASIWHFGVHYLVMNLQNSATVFMDTTARDLGAGPYFSNDVTLYTKYGVNAFNGGVGEYTLNNGYLPSQPASVKNKMRVQNAISGDEWGNIAWVSGLVSGSVSGDKDTRESSAYGLSTNVGSLSYVRVYVAGWDKSKNIYGEPNVGWYVHFGACTYPFYYDSAVSMKNGVRWIVTQTGYSLDEAVMGPSDSGFMDGVWNATVGGFSVSHYDIPMASIDAAWVAFTSVSVPILDEYDGRIMFVISGSDGSETSSYLVKVDAKTGQVVWVQKKDGASPYYVHPNTRSSGGRILVIGGDALGMHLHVVSTLNGDDEGVFDLPALCNSTPSPPGFATDAESGVVVAYMPSPVYYTIARAPFGFFSNGVQSTDGDTWEGNNYQGSIYWSSVAGKLFGYSNTSNSARGWYSSDGVTRTPFTSSGDSVFGTMAESSSVICGVGYEATGTSTDGVTWTKHSAESGVDYTGICWSDTLGRFFACGYVASTDAPRVMHSTDGASWSDDGVPSMQPSSIAWSPEVSALCIAGNSGNGYKVALSQDGNSWVTQTLTTFSSLNASYPPIVRWSVALGRFLYLGYAVLSSGDPVAIAFSSVDGVTWEAGTCPAYQWQDMCVDPLTGWAYAVSPAGKIARTKDGLSWTLLTTPQSSVSPTTAEDGLPSWTQLRTLPASTMVSGEAYGFRANFVFGSPYTGRGQLLRPLAPNEAGAANGPALAKTRRTHQIGALVSSAGDGVYVGTNFSTMYELPRRDFPGATPYEPTKLFSGVTWTAVEDGYTFNSTLSWETRSPYPLTVNAFGAFLHTQDR